MRLIIIAYRARELFPLAHQTMHHDAVEHSMNVPDCVLIIFALARRRHDKTHRQCNSLFVLLSFVPHLWRVVWQRWERAMTYKRLSMVNWRHFIQFCGEGEAFESLNSVSLGF